MRPSVASIVTLSITLGSLAPWQATAAMTGQTADIIGRASIVGRDVSLGSNYDYIIAGAGPAGLTVADRLSEDPRVKVLIIEAGDLDQGEEQILIPFFALQAPEKYWWNLTSVPLPGLGNRTQVARSGKIVGGGTAVNAMMVTRGSKGDYDLWEELGNDGWGWNSMLPYFKKSETFTPPSPELAQEFGITWDMQYHGTSGPFQTSYPPFLYPGVNAWLKSLNQIGVDSPKDLSAAGALGGGWIPNTLDPVNRTRSYARTAHYNPVQNRQNLHLLPSTKVTKITFRGKTATGVTFATARGEGEQSAKASKEVIIAAGALHTPQVLQLSGVGPKKLLNSLGIAVVSDLPGVGANFQDHAWFFTGASALNEFNPSPSNTSNATWLAEQRQLYDTKREGVYTNALSTSVAFLSLEKIGNSSDAIINKLKSQKPSDVFPSGTDSTILAGWKAARDLIVKYTQSKKIAAVELMGLASVSTGVVLAKPLSRGFLTLSSIDPFDDPVVDYGTLINPVDLDILVESIGTWRRMLATPALQAMAPTAFAPTDNVTSTPDLQNFVRQNTISSVFHPSGTAAMMKKQHGGVVGPDLLVYGTKGLSVIDASILPVIPSSHTTTVMYAVGEKAADIIKSRH